MTRRETKPKRKPKTISTQRITSHISLRKNVVNFMTFVGEVDVHTLQFAPTQTIYHCKTIPLKNIVHINLPPF